MKFLGLALMFVALNAFSQQKEPSDVIRDAARSFQRLELSTLENYQSQVMLLSVSNNIEDFQKLMPDQDKELDAAQIISEELDLQHILSLGELTKSGLLKNPKTSIELLNRICKTRTKEEKAAIKSALKVKCK